MRDRFLRELAALGLPGLPAAEPPIRESDIEHLPEVARRYLRAMGVVGRGRDRSFRVSFAGRFRRRPDEQWMPCEVWQYDSAVPVARIFHLRLRMAGIVPVLGRDTYVNGRGRMVIRPLDLFTVGDDAGEEFDIGELVTWLNDAVLIAPGFLLRENIEWAAIDDRSFAVSVRDVGRSVSAQVFLDERGLPVDFRTTDRFLASTDGRTRPVRMEWSSPIDEMGEIAGRRVMTRARAVWQMPEGPFCYADFTMKPQTLAFDVSPGA